MRKQNTSAFKALLFISAMLMSMIQPITAGAQTLQAHNPLMRLSCSAPSGMNTIHGTVFYDDNANTVQDGGELDYEGATVRLYADADSNGTPDGAALTSTITDSNGEYAFDTALVFTESFSYDQRISSSTNDAYQRNEQMKVTDNDVRCAKGSDEQIAGFRYTGLSIPTGATIDSAFLILDNADKADNTSVDIFAEDNSTTSAFSSDDYDITDRTKTTANVTFDITWAQDETDYSTPDIKSVIQELVDSYGAISDLVLLFYDNVNSNDESKIISYDDVPSQAARLKVYYTVGSADAYHFLTDVDAASLPATSSLTTSTYQSAAFYVTETEDCSNDFGFDITTEQGAPDAVADNPSIVSGPVTIDVLANDSDTEGDNIILTSISSAPDQGATAVINDNGTPSVYTDDYIDFTPTGSYTGIEYFDYKICDDGFPSGCDSVTVAVTISANSAPSAADDIDSTPVNFSVEIDVLDNDSDTDGHTITISSISSAPDQGGSAVIDTNGTSDPSDDFIDFTPSGSYEGNESFDYIICDNGLPSKCDTATVTVTITESECVDSSTAETLPEFAYGSEWQYNDSGDDLGTNWKNFAYDDDCWSYGDSKLGFGDAVTTTLTDHGGATYYFRKHITMHADTSVGYFTLGMVRDDGAVVYVNGTEVYRSNMGTGTVQYNTLATSSTDGADETAEHFIQLPGSMLTTGDNVIAVEVHQDALSNGDMTFDMEMTTTYLVAGDTVLIAAGADWNYNDNGIDLDSAWRELTYTETANEWEAGPAELGYGDTGESTILDYGSDINDKYPTYYFRHYFNVESVDASKDLYMEMIRDDGAIVYINGTQVWNDKLAASGVTYSTYADAPAVGGTDETTYFNATVPASILNAGKNVVAVEIHQVNATSSDLSFNFKMSLVDAAPLTLDRGPYLQLPTSSSMIVKFRTNNANFGKVIYGTSLGSMNDTVTSTTLTTDHSIKITGLDADTKYFYSFGAADTIFAGGDTDYFFYTSPTAGSTSLTRAWVLGDAGTADANQEAVRDAYYSYATGLKTDMILLLGDNAYNDGTDLQYQTAIFESAYEDIIRQTPMWSCPGNHDIYSASSSAQTGPYYDIFTFPKAAEAGGEASGTEAYYSWDYGQIHFISLDSDDTPRDTGSAMLTWLESDLAATTQPWIVTIFHHPPYTKGSHDSDNTGDSGNRMGEMRENVLPILESYGVDLVLSGHSHSYERSYLLNGHYDVSSTFDSTTHALDVLSGQLDTDCSYKKTTTGPNAGEGAVYITAGSSGKVTGTLTKHNAMYSYLYQRGSVILEVEDNRMDVKFLNESETVADYFTIDKDISNAAIDTTIEAGDTIILTASWGDDFSWSPGSETTQSITVFPSDTTQYIVTNASGCLADTINVNVEDFTPNNKPVAVADAASTADDLAVEVDVLANDTDVDVGDDLTITGIAVAPNHGATAVINNNGTPGDPSDDFIDFTPSGSYTGDETFDYIICDDGSPSLCDTATVTVTITVNTKPVAVADNDTTDETTSIEVDVLANDSDPDPHNITLTAITSAPNQGGTAVINNNGTPGDPSDDFIDYTPSGSYTGIETFDYSICDDATSSLCDTATVTILVQACTDGSTAETAPSWAYGSEWKYEDSGDDLGTEWTSPSYSDICWSYGDANLGFGDAATTTINDHGDVTYYFRKHFSVADVTAINYVKLDMKRDDGAAVYINGEEVYRTNLPNGELSADSLATQSEDDTLEYSVVVPASVLTDGDNVIAVEVHQVTAGDTDMSFDLKMSTSTLDESDSILVALNEIWNYNDNGLNLGGSWKTESYTETANNWKAGEAELGFGDDDETTVVGFGPDENDKYITTYFRHYFSTYNFAPYDTLVIRLRRDDGAIVYINGTEVVRDNMPASGVDYLTHSSTIVSGADESTLFEFEMLANMLNSGSNVIAVEIHNRDNVSSDLSFELELSLKAGSSSTFYFQKEEISGTIFLDSDISRDYDPEMDIESAAVMVSAYQDVDEDGELDETDPFVARQMSNYHGEYTLLVYPPAVRSWTGEVGASNDDAIENSSTGVMTRNGTSEYSVDPGQSTTMLFDMGTEWAWYDKGDHGDSDWNTASRNTQDWHSGDDANFGFNDIGPLDEEIDINKNMNKDHRTYYFWRQINISSPNGPNYGQALVEMMRDDGVVVYINGVEKARLNMPTGPVEFSTVPLKAYVGAEESDTISFIISDPCFVTGTNTIAVEVHNYEPKADGDRDLHFDMALYAQEKGPDDVGLRFTSLPMPPGATVANATLKLRTATAATESITVMVEGESANDAAQFLSTSGDISSRGRTASSVSWNSSRELVAGNEVFIDSLHEVIQEIIDLPGWAAGNDIALMLSGFTNEFYMYDAGYPAELIISYIDTSQHTIDYLVFVEPSSLPPAHVYLTDSMPVVTISDASRRASGVDIGYIGGTSACVASSDDSYDGLHLFNRFSGDNKFIGAFGGSREIEAIALNENADTLWAVDGGHFGQVNLLTGAFTEYDSIVGTGTGSLGAYLMDDIDGLAFDLTRGILWATQRRTGSNYDLLLTIDPATGMLIPDAFGAGVDYLVIDAPGTLYDLDDIAANPNTGNLFAVNNNNGALTNLIEIVVSDGSVNVIGGTGLLDMEGQGFHNDGKFYSTSGRIGSPVNSFYEVDTATAALSYIGHFESEGDFEGCDCKSGAAVNALFGTVFHDVDENGILDATDIRDPDVMVYMFADSDNDSTISEGDALLDSVMTDANGEFLFITAQTGTLLVTIDPGDLPFSSFYTTPYIHEARFKVTGRVDLANNIGYKLTGVLPVQLISFTGENVGSSNYLSWSTASEMNSSHFDVQRSKDGANFETIGVVIGAGTTSEVNDYSLIDDLPYLGRNYYRLKQVDLDGTFEYSNTIQLDVLGTEAIRISTWPNPAQDQLHIKGLLGFKAMDFDLVIYDSFGQQHYAGRMNSGTDELELDVSMLDNGYYMVTITSGVHEYTFSFVKQ